MWSPCIRSTGIARWQSLQMRPWISHARVTSPRVKFLRGSRFGPAGPIYPIVAQMTAQGERFPRLRLDLYCGRGLQFQRIRVEHAWDGSKRAYGRQFEVDEKTMRTGLRRRDVISTWSR